MTGARIYNASMCLMVCLLVVVMVPVLNASTPERDAAATTQAAVDDFVEDILRCRDVVGLSLVAVRGQETLISRGYGFTDTSRTHEVTDETLFGIASLSKAFTAVLLGKLLQQKGLQWSSRVRDILGEDFCFSDDTRTNMMTVEDLLSHNTGLSQHNMMRMQDDLTRSVLARKIRYFPEKSRFRASYVYNNNMYGLASYITELIGGDTWENLLSNEIFNTLGMTSSTFTHVMDMETDSLAKPYILDPHNTGSLRSVSSTLHSEWGKIGGSGSVVTHARDMAKWVKVLLNDGVDQSGAQAIPSDVISDVQQRLNARISVTSSDKLYLRPQSPVSFDHHNYGMGWRVGTYRGLRMVVHTGSSFGYLGQMTLLPDLQLGVFTSLTGDDYGRPARRLLHLYTLDLLMGETPWINQTDACDFPQSMRTAPPAVRRERPPPARPLANYAGTYGNFLYGSLEFHVDEATGGLVLGYGMLGRWELLPTDEAEVFEAVGVGHTWMYRFTRVEFSIGTGDTVVQGVSLPEVESSDPPYFTRDLRMSDDPMASCPTPSTSGGTRVAWSAPVVYLALFVTLVKSLLI